MNVLTVAKYLRLSSEDDDKKTVGKLESNSIANQRNLLDSYISRAPDLAGARVLEFLDDGWSGKSFERPGVQKLLDGVRRGEIGCIIVKDLSRFGRDYLEVGNYISRVFPFMGVRFIAVNDNFDSINPLDIDSLETSFKTLLYDLYSRDLSRKVKSAKMMRAKRGMFLSPFAPYGYTKDPENHNHLLIDPEAAMTVREIFQMMIGGHTTEQIARYLNSCSILPPMQYKKAAGCHHRWHCIGDRNFWTRNGVATILRDEQYIGKSVYGKRESDRIGQKHTVKVSRENWVVVSDTHDGIVTQEEFEKAQASMRKLREYDWKGPSTGNVLKRKVRCGVCGHVMTRSSEKEPSYYCKTPRVTDAWSCPVERFPERDILDFVTEGLRVQAETAVEMNQIWNEVHRRKKKDRNALRKAMTALQAEESRQEREISSLYESLIMGEISTEKYLADKAALTQAKEKTAERIASLDAEMNNMNQDGGLDNQFIEAFKKYSAVECLSEEIVAEVLDSVLVYPDNRIEIVWKCQDEFEKLVTELSENATQ